jgi:hypothetical protein
VSASLTPGGKLGRMLCLGFDRIVSQGVVYEAAGLIG